MFFRFSRIVLFLTAVLLPILLAGCRTNEAKLFDKTRIDSRKVFISSELTNAVSVVEAEKQYVFDEDNLLRARVRLRNEMAKEMPVEYRFIWYDSAQLEVDSMTSALQTRKMPPGDVVLFSAMAPNPKVVDFVLRIRRQD